MLLPFFSDKCEFPEIMYSIIHAIESFEDEIYIEQLFKGILILWKSSPEWTLVLHFRILNSITTIAEYCNQLPKLSPPQKRIIKEILLQVEKDSPQFTEKCQNLLSAI